MVVGDHTRRSLIGLARRLPPGDCPDYHRFGMGEKRDTPLPPAEFDPGGLVHFPERRGAPGLRGSTTAAAASASSCVPLVEHRGEPFAVGGRESASKFIGKQVERVSLHLIPNSGASSGASGGKRFRKSCNITSYVWRVLRSQCRGREFESLSLHL